MSLTTDIKGAVRRQWALPAGADLTEFVPLDSLYSGAVSAEPAPPYAQLVVERDGEPQFMQAAVAGAPYLDTRRLVVRVWAAGDTISAAEDTAGLIVPLVQTLLSGEAWWDVTTGNVLLSCLPGDEEQVEDDKTYNAEQVWRTDIPFQLLFQRALP